MAEITLKQHVDKTLVPFVVNLENDDTNETITHKYFIKRLGGKAAMQVQMMLAEFARDKNRDALLGSAMMTEILNRTTKQEGTTLDLLDIFDNVDDKGLEQLCLAMIEAAKSPSTEA